MAASIRAPQPADLAAPESATNRRHAAPAAVAEVVLQALNAAQPQARYLVGTRWESDRVVDALMARLIDAAQSPSQALNADELVARLRQAWLRRGG